ncbi:MAG: acyl-CoA dehydrogenase family protein, partial [Acidimicrobiales bacterium]|nr:acyl-CoA dehydrogenase family protein [Acidimicrobiales bacterium]
VWTSYARYARWGICLARTGPPVDGTGADPGRRIRKHDGISYLVVDMSSPGIEIRPLVQITGEAEFNEVFLDEVFVPDDHLVGALDGGWAVANTTLAHERGTNFPFKEQVVHEVFLEELFREASGRRLLDDVLVAEELAQVFVELRLLRLHNWRTLSRLGRGIEPGAESSVVKLAWTEMT